MNHTSTWKKPSIYNIKEVAELSTPVLSANYHQFLYLNKQLRILERSETTYINNITIEQKIMYRRYMEKLYRSKINFARMWENKDMERNLRGQKLSYLNNGGVNMEAEATFLKLLQRRALSAQISKGKRSVSDSSQASSEEFESFMDNITIGQSRRSKPMTPCFDRGRRNATNTRQGTVRPVTAVGVNVDKEFNVLPGVSGNGTDAKIQNFIKIVIGELENGGSSDDEKDTNSFVEVPKLKLRPKTCSGKIQRRHTTTTMDVRYLMPSPPKEPRKKRRSIFVENSRQKKLDQQIEKLRSRDFRSEIKSLCESLEPYISQDGDHLDYYSQKVMDSIASSQRNKWTAGIITPCAER
ncbi:hypothetical protein LOTGIDRAFT_153319 [Lottia gigantea]|uniref:Uncharacterized protein n=1 Tax=Lottia gigantea TaxID=225164 RepID=V4AAQ7_LOTGI|nr:hypothetical protein LOTGIDRAFT_153319 [Lottia gigantea]ESO93847.1 hypothetical protein LOTGIDRAFT_153319 [Lottia gigantea]